MQTQVQEIKMYGRNFQFDVQVPDGHSGPVCGYGLQPSILPPRTHLQVLNPDLLYNIFIVLSISLLGTSLPYPGCGVSTKSLIEGSFFCPPFAHRIDSLQSFHVQVPKEPEVLFHRPPHQLHQSRLQLLQAHHQCQVWKEDPVSSTLLMLVLYLILNFFSPGM